MAGSRIYGPGIADDKGGSALILHTLAALKAMGFREFGTLTVVINGDEEINSPASRTCIQRLAAEHDAVLSCEPPLRRASNNAGHRWKRPTPRAHSSAPRSGSTARLAVR
ncbi:MAG: M20/M25/M40 family metallo-hydrolase [Nitrospira sp.]|nr:M20/M25/M40 family metallo-hydrolase [Nitrospira sp.]